MKKIVLISTTVLSLSACAQTASWHTNEVQNAEKQNFTVGVVQRDIKKGMSSADVASILGSPNIVSTDENGNEVWIYDKFSTDAVASTSNGLTFSLKNVGAGAVSRSQSTITVIIKFDSNNKVRDTAYHTSRF
jgi:outer membrane protein assembly factor BamE (lipoprotein component of BamABCDE complex)